MSEIFGRTITNTDKKLNIVCDIDEVIIYQTPKWCKMIYEEMKKDPKMMKELKHSEGLLSKELVLFRDKYYLSDWIKKDELQDCSDYVKQRIMDIYDDCEDFYDDVEPTKLGIAINGLCNTNRVEHIYFVSKGSKKPAWDSKMKFMNECMYVEGKTTIIRVPVDCRKSEYINKYIADRSKINHIFEDQPSNIVDMLDNSFKDNRDLTVWTPNVGYGIQNYLTLEEFEKYAKEGKSIRVTY